MAKHERNGGYSVPEYSVWARMKQRCNDKNDKRYNRYGGRGITVCKEWSGSFNKFYSDMGPRPFKGAQIDRIDNDRGYYKENCRWVTQTQNARNRQDGKLNIFMVKSIRDLHARGVRKTTISNWFGVNFDLVWHVINGRIWRNI